jgi:uncharacterized membrane protein HdeD (DUF308 family)
MRKLRQVIDRFVVYGGVIVILASIVVTDPSRNQVVLVLLGLLLVQLGVWRIASRVLPSTRTNQRLRDEVDQFLASVRELYRLANDNQSASFNTLAEGLRGQADGIIEAAGRDLKS